MADRLPRCPDCNGHILSKVGRRFWCTSCYKYIVRTRVRWRPWITRRYTRQ